MGGLALTMPLPVPCNTRVTEVRVLSSPRVVLSRGASVLRPAPTPSAPPWTSVWPHTRTCSASIVLDHGCGRASPVRRSAFAACRLLYAGAVPGCSRFHGPDCCLRLTQPGSTRSVPHGVFFRRGRVHVRCGLQLRFSSLQRRDLARRRRLTSPLLWRLAGAGLTPADRSALCRAHHYLNSRGESVVSVL